MSQAPSMPMFWDAYLADTTHLTTEEHGAYLLLLGAMWRRNGWVPDDDRDVARILGLTRAKWVRTKQRLSSLLTFTDGQITQKNLLKIWQITQEKIAKNRENGAKGGRPSSNKNNDMAKANGFNSRNPNETIPEPEPEPYRKEEPTGSSKKRGTRIPEDWVPDEVFARSEGLTAAECAREADKFRDYWRGLPGQRGVKQDWGATWKNWVRKAADGKRGTTRAKNWRDEPEYRNVL